jgi:hypothetical protein
MTNMLGIWLPLYVAVISAASKEGNNAFLDAELGKEWRNR